MYTSIKETLRGMLNVDGRDIEAARNHLLEIITVYEGEYCCMPHKLTLPAVYFKAVSSYLEDKFKQSEVPMGKIVAHLYGVPIEFYRGNNIIINEGNLEKLLRLGNEGL